MPGIDPASAIRLSLLVAAWAVIACTPFALGLGWLLARKQFFGKALVSTLILAPLVLPPVVTGFLLLRAFGRHSPLGPLLQSLGCPVPFTLTGAVVAAIVMALPLYTTAIRTAIQAVDRRYEEVAATCGLTPGATWRQITLPLALPGIAAGAVLAFARALGEFGATAVLAGNVEGRTRTIALAIYSLLESPNGDAAVRQLVWASLGLSLGALVLYELLNRWQRRRLGEDRDG
ncbi:MAG: molybdate ABC transporter permease subunit [bacterium]